MNMGKGGKRSLARRLKQEAEFPVYRGLLGKWGALLVHRGARLLQLEQAGPPVVAATPKELREKTEEALGELLFDDEKRRGDA
jgi:hypothetical protein